MQGWGTKGAYVYNAFGQRTVKTADSSASTAYLYDFDGNLVMESDGVRGPFQKEYIHGGGSRLAMAYPGGGPVCRDGAGAPKVCVYFYHNDRLGTPELMTDLNKMQVWKADYDAFGEAAVDPASTVVNNFRFPGQYYDAETGLHYNLHRYYDPKTGRYLTPDPIGLAGGINPYVYVGGDPVNLIDPLGLDGAYPDAWSVGASGTIGLLTGLTGGFEVVVNSESGEVSLFINGGFEGGVASFGMSAKAGLIWNLDKNCEYNGPFLSGNFGGGPLGKLGVSIFGTSDNITSPNLVPGPYGAAVTIGVSLIPVSLSGNSTLYKTVFTIPLLGYILDPTGTIFNAIDKGHSPVAKLDK